MKLSISVGMLLLAIFLILYGLIVIFDLSFKGVNIVMGILAILAGILIIFGR